MKAFITKGLLCASLVASIFGSTSAFALYRFPGTQEMKNNFESCEKSDESWDRRWGQYVVAFDQNEASRICRQQSWDTNVPLTPELASCEVNGSWVWAGYFCREIYT